MPPGADLENCAPTFGLTYHTSSSPAFLFLSALPGLAAGLRGYELTKPLSMSSLHQCSVVKMRDRISLPILSTRHDALLETAFPSPTPFPPHLVIHSEPGRFRFFPPPPRFFFKKLFLIGGTFFPLQHLSWTNPVERGRFPVCLPLDQPTIPLSPFVPVQQRFFFIQLAPFFAKARPQPFSFNIFFLFDA